MKGMVVLGLMLSLTDCSKISSFLNQGKQAAEAAGSGRDDN